MDIISNREARDMLSQEAEDGFCCLGEVPVERLSGWSMGDSISEEGTATDLQEDERILHTDPQALRRTG